MEKACFHSTSGHCLGPAQPSPPPPPRTPRTPPSPPSSAPPAHSARSNPSAPGHGERVQPQGLPRACSTRGLWLPPFSRPGALSLSRRPRPDSPACPARVLAPRSFLSSRRGAPGPAAPSVRGPQHLPWGPPPISPGGSQASCSPPTSSPVPGQATFPCTCNPVTDCPAPLGVIPPRAHPLSQPLT